MPHLMKFRRVVVLIELAAAPVLLAGLPTLLSKDKSGWAGEEQHLAFISSLTEHVVFVHLRLLFIASFLPDLTELDRMDADGEVPLDKFLGASPSEKGES